MILSLALFFFLDEEHESNLLKTIENKKKKKKILRKKKKTADQVAYKANVAKENALNNNDYKKQQSLNAKANVLQTLKYCAASCLLSCTF